MPQSSLGLHAPGSVPPSLLAVVRENSNVKDVGAQASHCPGLGGASALRITQHMNSHAACPLHFCSLTCLPPTPELSTGQVRFLKTSELWEMRKSPATSAFLCSISNSESVLSSGSGSRQRRSQARVSPEFFQFLSVRLNQTRSEGSQTDYCLGKL